MENPNLSSEGITKKYGFVCLLPNKKWAVSRMVQSQKRKNLAHCFSLMLVIINSLKERSGFLFWVCNLSQVILYGANLKIKVPFFSPPCRFPTVLASLFEKSTHSPLNYFGHFDENPLNICVSLFLDSSLFHRSDVYPYTNATLSWFLSLQSKSWNQVM